jgi:hypothetical protein
MRLFIENCNLEALDKIRQILQELDSEAIVTIILDQDQSFGQDSSENFPQHLLLVSPERSRPFPLEMINFDAKLFQDEEVFRAIEENDKNWRGILISHGRQTRYYRNLRFCRFRRFQRRQ